MSDAYQFINKWTRPKYYLGTEWHGWYSAGVGRSRDSDALERANFDAMLEALQALPDIDVEGESGLQVVRESHWLVGWVEWIAIHESNRLALEAANNIMRRFQDYPVIDEERLWEYEYEECQETWEMFSERERAQYLREHVRRVYPFSGESVYSALRQAVKGSWDHAANMLPCPSDLIL